jgi:hypothetical protein
LGTVLLLNAPEEQASWFAAPMYGIVFAVLHPDDGISRIVS